MKDANPLAAEMLETSAAGYASTANALLKQAPHRGTYSGGAAARGVSCRVDTARRQPRAALVRGEKVSPLRRNRGDLDGDWRATDRREWSELCADRPHTERRRSAALQPECGTAALGPRSAGYRPDEFLIGAVGQLIARKGHDTLLDAMLSEDDAPAGPQLVRAQER